MEGGCWSIEALRDVSSLAASIPLKKNLMEPVRLCLIYTTGATRLSAGHTHETYDNRTRNCFRSPKYVRICGRLTELPCSRRSPRRQRRDGHTPHRNQASEPFREYACSHRA